MDRPSCPCLYADAFAGVVCPYTRCCYVCCAVCYIAREESASFPFQITMNILQVSPFWAGTQHSHLCPSTCARLSRSLQLLQTAWHRRQQRRCRDEQWSLQARCLELHLSTGWFRKFQTSTAKSNGINTSSSTYARKDNAETGSFTVLTGSLDKVSFRLRPPQKRRCFPLDFFDAAGEKESTPGTLPVARPIDSCSSVFPLQRVTVATKPTNRLTSSSRERELHWKTLLFHQIKTSTGDTRVTAWRELLLASTLSGSRASTSSPCSSRTATINNNESPSSGSSAASWTSCRIPSGSSDSKRDKSRTNKSMSDKRSRASHLVCYGTSCSGRCQQKLSDSYLNCWEKKKDIGIFHFSAETSKTWASAARLRSNTSSTAAAQKRYSTFLTTAESKTHSAVDEGASAGGENSFLCARGAEDSCSTGLKEVEAATVTKKTPSCRTDGNGAEGRKHVSATAAPVLAAEHEAVTTASRAASTTAGREEKQSEAEEAAARARDAETLWNTLVPERHWGLRSPMFWILLVLVLLLHAYNNKREKEKALSFTDEDKAERELREEVERRRQERGRRQREGENS